MRIAWGGGRTRPDTITFFGGDTYYFIFDPLGLQIKTGSCHSFDRVHTPDLALLTFPCLLTYGDLTLKLFQLVTYDGCSVREVFEESL